MIPIATIYSLEMSANGSPWCRTAPNATQSTDVDALLYSADGSPWWGHYPTGGTVTVYDAVFFGMNF